MNFRNAGNYYTIMNIVSVSEMRRLEAAAIADGVSGRCLMANAGEAAAREISRIAERLPAVLRRRFVVVAGKGNNGGDGWVVARCLHNFGYDVVLATTCDKTALSDDAHFHADALPADCPVVQLHSKDSLETLLIDGDIIVDALLGTGARGKPRGIYAELIQAINESRLPVFSLDVPSGLDADSGQGADAIRADWTITMGFPKSGLFRGDGFRLSGTVRVVGIGLPKDIGVNSTDVTAFAIQDAIRLLPRRDPAAHKNSFGHLACFCNSADYSGAGFLCAEAALRTGAGLVTLVTPELSRSRDSAAALIRKSLPGAAFNEDALPLLPSLLQSKTAVVYGPGTGAQASPEFLKYLLSTGLPMVIDADGLRLLAANLNLLHDMDASRIVLTPHPGEMKALMTACQKSDVSGCAPVLPSSCAEPPPSEAVARTELAVKVAAITGCIVVLKGRFTVVAAPDGQASINLTGDVSLATAGSGDVLSGCIGALLAEGMAPADAARVGVCLHGLAAEMRHCPGRSLVADDLPALLAEALAEHFHLL